MSEKDELKKILKNHEERITKLEKLLSVSKTSKIAKSNNYSGLTGGIQFLIDNKFFNNPKELNEIVSKLKEEGYHYGKAPIAKALSVGFTNKKKILSRFKEDKNFKYVIRK